MKLTIATFLPLLAVFVVADAAACSCEKMDLKDAYTQSDVIFTAKVKKLSNKLTWQGEEKLPTKLLTKVQFEQVDAYKGSEKDAATLYTEANSAACGFPFKKHQTYVVFAYYQTKAALVPIEEDKQKLKVSICSPTEQINPKEGQENAVLEFLKSKKDTK